jgi:hypothetical protein
MGVLYGWLPRLHDFTAGRAGALHEIRARHGRKPLEVGQRVLHRPVDQAVQHQAMPCRIDIGNASVVALVVQTRWRDDPIAVLQRCKRGRARRIGPPHLALELRTRAIAAVLAHHPPLLLGGIGRQRIFDRAGRSLGGAGARQHPRHTDGRDEARAPEKLTSGGREREHASPALADFRDGFSLRNALANAAERLLNATAFASTRSESAADMIALPFDGACNDRSGFGKLVEASLARVACAHSATVLGFF